MFQSGMSVLNSFYTLYFSFKLYSKVAFPYLPVSGLGLDLLQIHLVYKVYWSLLLHGFSEKQLSSLLIF